MVNILGLVLPEDVYFIIALIVYSCFHISVYIFLHKMFDF